MQYVDRILKILQASFSRDTADRLVLCSNVTSSICATEKKRNLFIKYICISHFSCCDSLCLQVYVHAVWQGLYI